MKEPQKCALHQRLLSAVHALYGVFLWPRCVVLLGHFVEALLSLVKCLYFASISYRLSLSLALHLLVKLFTKAELCEGILFQSKRSPKQPLDEARVSKMFGKFIPDTDGCIVVIPITE